MGGTQHAGGGAATSPSSSPSQSSASSDNTPPQKVPDVPLTGAIIESHRLGVAMVSPDQVFQSKQKSTCSIPQGPFPSAQQAQSLVFGGNAATLLKIGGYVTGWFQCFNVSGAIPGMGGVLGVMEAYDNAHAKSLAQTLALSASGSNSKSTTLPGLPQAYVGVYPLSEGKGNSAVNGLLVEDRMIIYVNLSTGTGDTGAKLLDMVRGMAAQLIRAERSKLATFTPTDVSQYGRLNDDPEQLDAKTAQPAGSPDWIAGGYSLDTYPEVAADQGEIPVLRKAGMKEMYLRTGQPSAESHDPTGAVSLYQLANTKAAKTVWEYEIGLAQHSRPAPTGLPLPKTKQRKGAPVVPKDIRCLLSHPSSIDDHAFRHDCYVLAGRYVAQVDLFWSADDASAAHVRSKDSSRVLSLVDKQLALTPQ